MFSDKQLVAVILCRLLVISVWSQMQQCTEWDPGRQVCWLLYGTKVLNSLMKLWFIVHCFYVIENWICSLTIYVYNAFHNIKGHYCKRWIICYYDFSL